MKSTESEADHEKAHPPIPLPHNWASDTLHDYSSIAFSPRYSLSVKVLE